MTPPGATHYRDHGFNRPRDYYKKDQCPLDGRWLLWESRHGHPPTWWFCHQKLDLNTLTELESNK